MKQIIVSVISVYLIGCGGNRFDTALFVADGDARSDAGADVQEAPDSGAPDAREASPQGAGGAGGASHGAGGSSHGAGGSFQTAGGAGGSSAPCDGGPEVTHSNGVGQAWTDCVPLGTYDQSQAMKACEAWCSARGCAGTGCVEGPECGEYMALGRTAGPSAVMLGWAWGWSPATFGGGTTVNVPLTSGGSCSALGMWR